MSAAWTSSSSTCPDCSSPAWSPRTAAYTELVVIRLTETFHWMFEDERWRYKILFQGLILLIPVVGVIALLGWMMVTCDIVLAGGQDVAPVGFHLRRGVRLFAIGILYWVGLGIPYSVLRYAAVLLRDPSVLGFLAQLYNDLALLAFAFLIVPVFVATDRGGLLGGIDVVRITGSILAHPLRTAVATLVVLSAVVIGILGFAVIVAAPFTITYAASVVASIAAWWSVPQRREPAEPDAGPPLDAGIPVPFRPPQMETEASEG
jgi:hypothetical protein